MSGPALAVRGVGHRFGARVALADVTISVPSGAFVALLGPNGAGKTTLFSILTRLYANREGAVSIFGHDLRREPSRALSRLGVVFQARTLDADLTVMQNLLYHAALHGMARRSAGARIHHLLERVGLVERRDEKVRALSGGQARRVEIARALVHAPSLLLLDEPTVGLDPASRAEIRAIVRGLVREEQLSVLWATHLFDEVELDDAVCVLHRGRIVADDVARNLKPSLAEAFRALTSEPERSAA